MTMTSVALEALLDQVNHATERLRASASVPNEVTALIDGLDSTLGAATPLQLEADPYLTTALWAAAFRADKALRHEDDRQRRRDVRVALEQFRHALRDITDNRPYDDGAPIRDVLTRTADVLTVPQKSLAELLGVSVRQLQRWLSDDAAAPASDDAARIRMVANLVNQLRHSFTGPGVVSWFNRKHPVLRRRPIELLVDPLSYPKLLGAAHAARAQSA